MAIPPFPSHDLAKLVLGYLAEEQLMTAYDEFLAASPYLDAFTNEFDRIFMTSLKNILAEYRAVKIFVESCKPFLLRKKLIQFSNLLEVVKFLVNNIDVNRFLPQQPVVEKSSSKLFSSRCDICNSLGMCICKRVQTSVSCQPAQTESSLDTSIETTSLADLPGSTVINQKKSLTETLPRLITKERVNTVIRNPNPSNNSFCEQYPLITPQENSHNSFINQDVSTVKADAVQQKSDYSDMFCNYNTGICNTGSFQEFATEVNGSSNNEKPSDPDSSTLEHVNAMNLTTKDNNVNPVINIKGPQQSTNSQHLLMQQSNESMSNILSPRTNLKGDQKITIISDVKVDAFKNKISKMPALHPITSTPLLQMQRIVINGTPAYNTMTAMNHRYNKEEIMAMPTIILVPSSGISKSHTTTQTIVVSSHSKADVNTNSTSSLPSNLLGPLVIDVPKQSNPDENTEKVEVAIEEPKKVHLETNLLKTIDLTHNSLPKDTNATQKSNTPNILPPTRKSSSTPRRTSHVRVLDFTTPRRILHETINEQDPIKLQTEEVIDVDKETPVKENKIKDCCKELEVKVSLPLKENCVKKGKKNWDSELRALAVKSEKTIEIKPKLNPKKIKSQKIKSINIADAKVKMKKERESSKKLSPKAKKTKKRTKSIQVLEQPNQDVINVKDSTEELNVISITEESDCLTESNKIVDNKNERINNSDERLDTPDPERLSLQNVICAKLNLSDLLETPYKQALYDIQMETPKFLGPDLLDEPVSDIKIMNIPTPRFFDTPKILATPSSYSSRPTDYSSGGSYYKPDDQDFVPEAIKCTKVVEKECSKEKLEKKVESEEKVESKDTIEKPRRSQRKCTRNVSYKRTTSPSSIGTSSASFSRKLKEKKEKAIDLKILSKSNVSTAKKKHIALKSPFKKDTPKKYIKIKPFRTSPLKSLSKTKKKSEEILKTLPSKSISKKITSSKEKNASNVTPVLTVPTKSRRKSSTPRKLNCTNTCKDIVNTSNDLAKKKQDISKDAITCVSTEDSDTEHQPLRWSDDGSQDEKPKLETTVNDTDEDINKIKEFIETTVPNVSNSDGSLHNDLIKRGFDVETAKSIERDLLDAIPIQQANKSSEVSVNKTEHQNTSDKIELDNSNNLQIAQDEEDDIEEVELSVHDCNDESENFITCQFNESEFKPKADISKLKYKFCMEVCIEDGMSVRLRSTNYVKLLEDSPIDYNPKETEAAVSSISNIDKLYTPFKNRRATCFEIFDSTLTSIDSTLKSEDKDVYESVTEVVVEEQNVDVKDKVDLKKRKRVTSEVADESLSKKTKTNEYMFNTTNIQNLDIESLLSKLHGP